MIDSLVALVEERLRDDARCPFVIGITGGVAVGKSTLARQLANALVVSSEILSTDAFLLSNDVLTAHDLFMRNGYPETYDLDALNRALDALRDGATSVNVPVYSHEIYDVVAGAHAVLPRADVVIVEGLPALRIPVDLGVYVHADEALLVEWYSQRFIELCDAGREDPTSFFHRFAAVPSHDVPELARSVWDAVNGPNLRENVLPLRERADVVVVKGPDHAVLNVSVR